MFDQALRLLNFDLLLEVGLPRLLNLRLDRSQAGLGVEVIEGENAADSRVVVPLDEFGHVNSLLTGTLLLLFCRL